MAARINREQLVVIPEIKWCCSRNQWVSGDVFWANALTK
jgi:hypothetical protein